MRRAIKSLDARSAVGKERRGYLIQELKTRRDIVLSDLFGALSRNKVGWGHTTAYYAANPTRQPAEAFANLFELYSRKDRASWLFVEQELPELAVRFEAVIKELGKT